MIRILDSGVYRGTVPYRVWHGSAVQAGDRPGLKCW